MLIVCAEEALVEAELVGGRPGVSVVSGGVWGRGGMLGSGCCVAVSGDRWLRPRRARCRGCAGTHVLLPDLCVVAAPGRGGGDRGGDRGEGRR